MDIACGCASHGYILSGPKGCGKHTAARLIAAAAVCTMRTHDTAPLPCGKCETCHRILHNISADVLYINAGDRATIGVDQIRTIRQSLYVTPNDGDKKFYIIEDAHTMTVQAQNALLLSLEDPPPFVVFLLLTEDSATLLETIRSRAPVLSMELFSPQAVLSWLKTQALPAGVRQNEDHLTDAAMLSGGSLGKAMALASDTDEKSDARVQRHLALDLLSAIFTMRVSDALVFLQENMPKHRESFLQVLFMIKQALRDLILLKKKAGVPGQFLLGSESVCVYATKYSMTRLLALHDLCQTAIQRTQSNVALSACATSFLLHAMQI